MANHVHKVVQEKEVHLPHIMQSHKGYTARQANKALNRSGQFWQRESFDQIVRDEIHLIQKVKYTMLNPVASGLVNRYQEWPYSFINPTFQWMLEI
jgi:REP element-mobilizing transposase RayT